MCVFVSKKINDKRLCNTKEFSLKPRYETNAKKRKQQKEGSLSEIYLIRNTVYVCKTRAMSIFYLVM